MNLDNKQVVNAIPIFYGHTRKPKQYKSVADLKKSLVYPPAENAVFEAYYRQTQQGLLISECQDFITTLGDYGYRLTKIRKGKLRTNENYNRH
jgi:hypothetical protein